MKLLFLSFMVWACTQPQSPTSVEPAAKALIDPFSSAVEWSCGTDSVWSVFNGHFAFYIDGDQVAIRERLAQRSLTHHTHDATMTYDESRCMLHSGFVSADSVTRIWKGYVWRDSYYRYYLQDEAGTYRINRRFTQADGSYDPPFGVVWYRDFSDLNNRFKPRPDGLYEIRKYNVHSYYLPVNFSRAALDTLYWVPKDDRPYLVDPIVGVDYAPDEPAALAPRVSSGPTGSSSTSSSSTGTGTPTTTVPSGDDGPNIPEEPEENEEEPEEEEKEPIVDPPQTRHVVSARVLAQPKSCCIDNGGGVISRFPNEKVGNYITEITYSDGSCVRSECGNNSYPCSGSTTSSIESCQNAITNPPTYGGGSCSHGYIRMFECDTPCPLNYTCD